MTRLLSGVVLAAAALAAILLLPVALLRALASLVAMLAAHEYAQLTGSGTGWRAWLVTLAAGAACWWAAVQAPIAVLVVLLAVFAGLVVHVLFRGRPLHPLAAGVAAPVYVGLPLGMLVGVHTRGGWEATVLLVATVVVSDSAQFYTGRLLGRRPLAPAISPKKTVEGALGGVVCATLFMVVAGAWALPGAGRWALAGLGLAVVVLGICGDLFESRLKRMAGVKDSSSLIPGHGGVLDRIDALLFATPAVYLFVRSTV